jgi:guanosine-3',5'-bis(diphosphate) 3'-pyrophosphohydrolase
MADLEKTFRPLLEAVAFAARAHQGQLRKDKATPYVSHVFRVGMIVREIFGIADPRVLTAAVLHDVIEDTTTDHDDLSKQFGREVADWVAALSKDKRLGEDEREQTYGDTLAQAPWQVQVCKLADVFDNVLDSGSMSAEARARSFRNAHRYLERLKAGLKEEARRPWEIVAQLVADLEGQQPSGATAG